MSDQIDFDERIAAQLEVVYRTRDIKRRRALAQQALAPQPGDDVLDVGCGPGFYVVDILDIIGPNGSVTGVDTSARCSQAFGGYMPAHIRQYLANLDDIDQAEVDAWLADLEALDAHNAYSFAVLQLCFSTTRPINP